MSDEEQLTRPLRQRRSGSERRKMQPRISFRVDADGRAKIDRDAAAAGVSVGSYLRQLACSQSSLRVRRRPLPSERLLAQLKGEAGRVDGNLAQFLRLANRGEVVCPDELADSIRAVRDFYTEARAALFDLNS